MAVSTLVDAGFLVALLRKRDTHNRWAAVQAREHPPPWLTCEAALSEAFHLIGSGGSDSLSAVLRRQALVPAFALAEDCEPVLSLMRKYSGVPMSLADACLVRMTETKADPLVLTTDSDFRIYRRKGRQTIPCIMPR